MVYIWVIFKFSSPVFEEEEKSLFQCTISKASVKAKRPQSAGFLGAQLQHTAVRLSRFQENLLPQYTNHIIESSQRTLSHGILSLIPYYTNREASELSILVHLPLWPWGAAEFTVSGPVGRQGYTVILMGGRVHCEWSCGMTGFHCDPEVQQIHCDP